MKYTQMLVVEIGSRCNLSKIHTKCPADCRFQEGMPITNEEAVQLILDVYQNHGFKGTVAFHYYNEPMLEHKRLFYIMKEVKEAHPDAKFLLWTNGSIRPDDERMSLFYKVIVSKYGDVDEDEIMDYFNQYADTLMIYPELDNRMTIQKVNRERCRRPLIEFVIDNYGYGRLCCYDWNREVDLGNIRVEGIGKMLEMRQGLMETLCRRMDETCPDKCKNCGGGMAGNAGFIEPQIAESADRYYGI